VAVASLAVVDILVLSVLALALVPLNSYWGLNGAAILSILVSGLIIGYVFAGGIQEESRIKTIGQIVLLTTALLIVVVIISYAAVGPYFIATVNDRLRNMYNTSSWTDTDWFANEMMVLTVQTAVNVVIALVFNFIGLYLGSMRKPSAKTKE